MMTPAGKWRTVSVKHVGDQREVVESGLFEGVRLFKVIAMDADDQVLKTIYYSGFDNTAVESEEEALKRALAKKAETNP